MDCFVKRRSVELDTFSYHSSAVGGRLYCLHWALISSTSLGKMDSKSLREVVILRRVMGFLMRPGLSSLLRGERNLRDDGQNIDH